MAEANARPWGPIPERPQDGPPARLRILPIYNRRDSEPSHYVILDRVDAPTRDLVRDMTDELEVPVLAFAFEVELPDVDQAWEDGYEELIPLHRPDGSEI